MSKRIFNFLVNALIILSSPFWILPFFIVFIVKDLKGKTLKEIVLTVTDSTVFDQRY